MPKLDIGADLIAMAERIAKRMPDVTAEVALTIEESRLLYVLLRSLTNVKMDSEQAAEVALIVGDVDVAALMAKLGDCGSEAMLRAVLSVADTGTKEG